MAIRDLRLETNKPRLPLRRWSWTAAFPVMQVFTVSPIGLDVIERGAVSRSLAKGALPIRAKRRPVPAAVRLSI